MRRPVFPAADPVIEGYELVNRLGHGGQGAVYKAVQHSTKRTVAVKILLHGGGDSIETQKRFEREVELAASLKHPNIITVFESGFTEDGRPFYAMDYIPGVPLGDYVNTNDLTLGRNLQAFSARFAWR